jgi:heme exporter protein D
MIWESWDAFWAMGGYGLYVWGSYAVVLICIVLEIVLARAGQRASVQTARELWEQETTHDATP